MSHYIVFKLDHREYGVEVKDLQEIALYSAIEKETQTTPHVTGIMESESAVIPVYQLRERSCLNYFKRKEKQILMVLVEGRHLGVVIDEVCQADKLNHLNMKTDLLELVSTNQANLFGYGKFNEAFFVLLNSSDLLMYEKSRLLHEA